jgi:hypothetical protein
MAQASFTSVLMQRVAPIRYVLWTLHCNILRDMSDTTTTTDSRSIHLGNLGGELRLILPWLTRDQYLDGHDKYATSAC